MKTGKRLRLGFEKEVERVEHRHLGDEVDVDDELPRPLREDEAREVVSLRVLLPVEEVQLRRDDERWDNTRVRQCGAGRSRITCGPAEPAGRGSKRCCAGGLRRSP